MMGMQQRMGEILEGLTKAPGVLGAAIISRDGLCVKSAGRPELSRETFSAMTATLMGAAEIALGELGGGRGRHIVASTESMRMALVGASRDLLLVACTQRDASIDDVLKRLEEAAASVAAALGG
ncbi:MAG TPA: roadblock/LC7 domain-containing protein [Candidatus Thermoplasmatota archaeon]|nr:roadblock/LC7 domain-containing protein [Candidatus Thermoplasmatota archaeon]